MVKGRKLAILDTHFPWAISGFRYDECSAIHRLRPETAFFSLYEMTDPFPAVVHRLADFPGLAAAWGVTDAYFVFLNFAMNLLGLTDHPDANAVQGLLPSMSLMNTFETLGIRRHVTLYAGGGLLPSTPPSILRAVAERVDTVFTTVAEVERAIPDAHFVPLLTNTGFYAPRLRLDRPELRLVFAADDARRKGLATLIDAYNLLVGTDCFHLDIIGPHDRHLPLLTNPAFSAHGWLQPGELRELYWNSDIFVSPVTVEVDDPNAGLIDGFPTAAATAAMATGCALVSSNPRYDHRVLYPGCDYFEIPENDPAALATLLLRLRDDRARVRAVAAAGCRVVRDHSVERVAAHKMRAIGL